MSNILPVGSVIQVNETKLIVMGYREVVSETYNFFYIVGIFPIGFTGDSRSLSLIPLETNYELIYTGYQSKAVNKYLEDKTKKINSYDGVDLKVVEETIDQILNRNGGSQNG